MQKKFQVTRTQAYPLGASFQKEGLRIAAVCDRRKQDGSRCEAGVILYDRNIHGVLRYLFRKNTG